jgi:hypothetical protein
MTTEKCHEGKTGRVVPAAQKPRGYAIPKERLELIQPHVTALAKTALRVSFTLPLTADASDFIRVLESEGK